LRAGVVLSGVRPTGQHHDYTEVIGRRPAELVCEDVHDLRRPQKLVLQIDQVPGGAQRAQVLLDDAEVASRRELVELLGDGAHDLQLHIAGAHHAGWLRFQALAGDRLPALGDVAADVGHRRPAQPRGDVVPAHPPAPRMLGRVITITAKIRQIDAADKRELVVDHDELLVVAVHRALVRVQRGLDPRPAHELIAPRAHRSPPRREHGHRSPQQHPNVDRPGSLSQ
jgi:hypothetical protein